MNQSFGRKILYFFENRWRKTVGFLFVFFIVAFFAPSAANAFNPQITYQGKLTNASGNSVTNGTYYFKVTIYNASSGGTCVYTASSTTSGTCSAATSTPITVTNGIFSINLGDTSADLNSLSSSMFTTSSLYLGITVCTGMNSSCDSEMTPRKRLTAATYAFEADYLGGVTTSTIGGTGSYIPATDSSGNLKITNSVYIATSTAGQFGVGTTTIPSGYKAFLDSTTAADKLLVIRGNSSQSGNMLELQNNSGRALGFFDSSGYLSVGSGSVTSTMQSASLIVGQATSYNQGKFYVDGATGSLSASSSIQTFGNTTSTGIIYALGGFISNASSSIGAGLQVAGNLSASSSITLSGNILANNNSSNLGAYGNAFASAYASGTIFVGTGGFSSSTFAGGLLSIGSISDTAYLRSTSLILSAGSGYNLGKFYVDSSGNVSASGTLQATNLSTFLGGFISNASSSIGAGLQVAGALNASSTLLVGGNILAGTNGTPTLGAFGNAFGNVYSSGTLFVGTGGFSSSTFAGGLLSIGSISDTAYLRSTSLILSAGSGYNLGKFYVDSSGNVSASGTLQATNLSTFLGGFISNASSSIGAGLQVAGALNASSTLLVGGNILAGTNGTPTLGAFGNAFGNVYSSGTLFIGSGDSSSTFTGSALSVGGAISGGGSGFSSLAYNSLTIGVNAITAKLGTGVFYVGNAGNLSTSGSIALGNGNFLLDTGGGLFTSGTLNIRNTGSSQFDGDLTVLGRLRMIGDATTSSPLVGINFTSTAATNTFTAYNHDANAKTAFVFNGSDISSTTAGTPLNQTIAIFQAGGTNKVIVTGGGNVYAKASFVANSSEYGIGDFAEFVDLSDGQKAEPGDVVIVDAASLNKFRKSDTAYAKEIAGVISDTGAFVIGAGGDGRAALAMAGLVRTKVTTENGPIKVGDYLVASSKSGYAMRYDPASGLPAGLVGMALETLESGEGKIKVLINKGYVAGSQAGAVTLQASVDKEGKLSGPVDLNLVGQSIINVKAIVGVGDKWKIDENGVMTNIIKTSQGSKTVYNQQSPDAEIVLSGSGQLQNGSTHIEFDQDTQDILSDKVPLKVSITLTGESEGGIYVSEKSIKGFTVREMKNGTGNAPFDWTAIARRKGYENQAVQAPVANTSADAPAPESTMSSSTPALPGQQISSPISTPAVDLPGANLSSSPPASSSTP